LVELRDMPRCRVIEEINDKYEDLGEAAVDLANRQARNLMEQKI
jgi:hypothetical protein